MKNKKITVVGLGYVGLPTALSYCKKGFEVNGFDIDKKLILNLNKGITKIDEKNVKILLKKYIKKKFFPKSCLEPSDIFIITVPSNRIGTRQNLKPLLSTINLIAKILKKNNLIIIETTCEVGTTQKIKKIINKKRPDLFHNKKENYYLSYSPERVFPGNSLFEIENNAKIIGGINHSSNHYSKKIISSINNNLNLTSDRVAETVKLVENSYRNIQLGFVNELSIFSEKNNLDVNEIIKLSNMHPRINLLKPGIGVGGHCIPIDPYFLINRKQNDFKSINTSIKSNSFKTLWVSKKILKIVKEKKLNKILILGLSYKENIGDLRESPAIRILKIISKANKNLKLFIYDPYVKKSDIKFEKYKNIIAIKKSSLINYKKITTFKLVNHKIFEKNKNLNKSLIKF
ncbi:nucleotide sugar dehydrogenase [Candidatus Pelagibacter communis]|uniref:nucleotide sugar dehydrogenase n=1 Tax=Pelagibacter ubique TaxID=198252 RepID=UPI00094CE7C8|nr:nucleotide sugar dehydrogenase [Candidatus Pelagibacter ubique]